MFRVLWVIEIFGKLVEDVGQLRNSFRFHHEIQILVVVRKHQHVGFARWIHDSPCGVVLKVDVRRVDGQFNFFRFVEVIQEIRHVEHQPSRIIARHQYVVFSIENLTGNFQRYIDGVIFVIGIEQPSVALELAFVFQRIADRQSHHADIVRRSWSPNRSIVRRQVAEEKIRDFADRAIAENEHRRLLAFRDLYITVC